MQNTENLLSNDLQIDAEGQAHLSQTAKWAKFLAIMGFVFCGFMLIFILAALANYDSSDNSSYSYNSRNQAMNNGFSIFFITAITVIWFVASLFTFRFATKMRTALQNTDQLSFNESLGNLAKNYKFMGVVTIIYIALMILAFLAFLFLFSFKRY